MKAYLINLPERKDRLDAFKERFRGWSLDLEVVPGVKHAEPWRGCALSHLAVVQKAKAAGLPWVLILEDDAAPTEPTPERFNALLPILWSKRGEWEIFNGGPSLVKAAETSIVQKEPPLLKTKGQAAHFILMNATAFDTILKDITQKDQQIIDLYYRNTFRMFATVPLIATQAKGHSTIDGKFVDYEGGLKESEAVLRSVLEGKVQAGGRRRLKRKSRKVVRRRLQQRKRPTRRQRGGQQPPPTFHVFIPSGGRPSLKALLDSLKPQLTERDALTLVFDGEDAPKKATYNEDWLNGIKCAKKVIVHTPRINKWSHGLQNEYQNKITPETTFIMYADDDDTYLPGAFDTLRAKCVNPECLYIAKMTYADDRNKVIPRDTNIVLGNISTQNGIIPFKDAFKSKWGMRYGGDFDYYNDLKTKVKTIEFLPDIIYLVGVDQGDVA